LTPAQAGQRRQTPQTGKENIGSRLAAPASTSVRAVANPEVLSKWKITITNKDAKPSAQGSNHDVAMPGGPVSNGKTLLRGVSNRGAGAASAAADLQANAPPRGESGKGLSLSERFSRLGRQPNGEAGRRVGQGKQLTRNAAGVVMPF